MLHYRKSIVAPSNHTAVFSSPIVDSSILTYQITENRASQTMKNKREGHSGNFDGSVVIVIRLDILVKYVILYMVDHSKMLMLQTDIASDHGYSLSEGKYDKFLQYCKSTNISTRKPLLLGLIILLFVLHGLINLIVGS